jgi:tetratricopeptide (TPR) repeat protein
MGLTLGIAFTQRSGFGFHYSAVDPEALDRARAAAVRGGSDAAAWYHLGLLLRADGRDRDAGTALSRAVELARAAVAGHPGSRHAAELLAGAQLAAGDADGAAVTLRGLARRLPRRWRIRAALGTALAAGKSPRIEEAERCYDAAVALAPADPGAHAARATFLFWTANREVGGLAEYRLAARLGRRNPYAVALPAWMDLAATVRRTGVEMASDATWAALSADAREAALATMERLRQLSRSREGRTGSRALTALGFLRYELRHDVAGALTALRAALRRDPGCRDAQEMTMHILALEDRWEELTGLCNANVRRRDRARLRLVAAFALEKLTRLPEAVRQLDSALRTAPDDLPLLLARAALALKQPAPGGAAEAGSLLDRAAARLADQPQFRPEYAFLHGLYLALTGDPQAARSELTEATAGPEARQARQALTLLEP